MDVFSWEQRKLENITSLITKGTTPKDKSGNGEVNFIKVENIDPSSGIISSCSRISLEEHEGYLKRSQLKENDILFSIAGTLGRTSVVNKAILPANTNQALAILRVSEGDISYLVTVLSGRAVSDFIKKNPTVGAQPNLSLEQVSNLEIPYPSIEEQHQIGTFFAKLDSLITLHQREYFAFDFNSRSAKIAQNTLSWEQRKLSDLFEERNEQAPMDEEYPLMAFIANIGVAPKGDRYDRSALVQDEKGKKYKRTEKGDFIYSSNNLETGSIGLNNYGNACISPVYSIFKSKHTVDPEFMGRILLRKEFINQMVSFRQGVVYGQWKIHEDDFLNLDILVPQTTEQQKIGGFFSELDKIITLHQHKPNKKGHDVLTVMPFKGNQRKPHYLCT